MNCRICSIPDLQGYNETLPAAAVCRMKQGSGRDESTMKQWAKPVTAPTLLVRLDPWPKVFLRNLADLIWPRRQPPLRLVSRPGPFWPDVFVRSRLPWRGLLESALYHALVLATLLGLSDVWPVQPQIVARSSFSHADVIYYPASEYLPPLNTGGAERPPKKGEPEYAPQPIISVPREADNRTQTIVTPPDIKLKNDVPLPNIVAWSQTPSAPLAATARSVSEMKLPTLPAPVVSPPPEVTQTAAHPIPSLPESVVAPPPALEAAATQRLGDITIGHQEVVPPAPQLPVAEQRAAATMARQSLGGGAALVVPPPPQIQGTGTRDTGGKLIALGIHPVAPTGPIEVPAGNRRGEFAATPQGKRGAPGTPDVTGGGDKGTDGHAGGGNGGSNGAGSGNNKNGIPSGLYVGAGPHATSTVGGGSGGDGTGHANASSNSSDPRLLADASPPRVTSIPGKPATEVPEARATDLDKKVFGDKKFYSMALNMPNLNSAGGSWVIRFAELKGSADKGELTAPLAIQKVDPAYPIELMRRNVGGTVSLYAVIRSDGSVGDVRVLRGVDDQLDEFARTALSRWRFRPATKNGSPVAIEAVVMIPFRPVRF